jgi:protein SCO1
LQWSCGSGIVSDRIYQELLFGGKVTKIFRGTLGFVICLAGLMITAACNQGSGPTAKQATPVSPVKHYQLKGKVVSIDKQGKMVNVDNEAIPGYMDAMTMPYQVKPESELDKLHPGDQISADLVVQDDGAWLQNISVAGSGASPSK